MTLPEELGISDFKVIEGDKALKIAYRWLSIFCPDRTSFKGIYGGKTYLWDEIDCVYQNEEANAEYALHDATSYYIFEDNFGQHNKELYVVKVKPITNKILSDFHVCPKNFAWSMAFTHEDGWIGPLFSKHCEFTSLQKENNKAVKQMGREYL